MQSKRAVKRSKTRTGNKMCLVLFESFMKFYKASMNPIYIANRTSLC